MNPLLGAIAAILAKIIPDPAQKAAAQLELARLANAGQLAELDAAVKVITAEATGNALQRSWRPILMLTFGGLVVARWFGWTAPNLTEAEYLALWSIVQLGIGGYTIGRTVEKVAPTVAEALRRRE